MEKEKISLNESVKEAITIALLKLMEKRPLDKIQVKDIAALAGVSRSSFYRNFESKEDVLVKYFNEIYNRKFSEEAEKNFVIVTEKEFFINRFKFVKNNQTFFKLLDKNNLVEYVFKRVDEKNLDKLFLISWENENEKGYLKAGAAGKCSGILVHWIKRNFKETEEELADILYF